MSVQTHLYTYVPRFDFSNIVNNKEFCDCKVKVGSKVFDSHKVLLSGTSKYFHEIFKKQGSSEVVVDTKLCTEKGFEYYMDFMYFHSCVVTFDNLPEMLGAAYNLKFDPLLSVVTQFINEQANEANDLHLLKVCGFALDKLPKFLKYSADHIVNLTKKTDFSFMAVKDFKLLLSHCKFNEMFTLEELISNYRRKNNVPESEFSDLKRHNPAASAGGSRKDGQELVHQCSPPEKGLFANFGLGRLSVSNSGSLNGRDPKTLCEEDPARHWFTESGGKTDGNAWVLFEFIDSKVKPSHYGLWSHGGASTLKSWSFQASNDKAQWVVLSAHTNDESLKEPFSEKVWPLQSDGYYRYFRIIQTGNNWNNNRWLYIQRVEIWGKAIKSTE